MFKKYLQYFGIEKEVKSSVNFSSYDVPDDKSLANKHLEYLQNIYKQNKDRQNLIENKNSQLVGQASIIISIFALFIPLLVGKLSGLHFLIVIPLILIFIVILFHYIITIFHSTKTLEINRYSYATPSIKNVAGANRAKTKNDFIEEEIKDLLYSISQNTYQTNRKGSNLIYATRNFRFACIIFSIFTVFIIVSSFFITSSNQKIDINSVDSSIVSMINKKLENNLNTIKVNTELKQIVKEINKLNSKLSAINDKIVSQPYVSKAHDK